MAKKRTRGSRRTIYWAWPTHLDSGCMALLYTKKHEQGNCPKPMIRVRVTRLG